LAAFRPCFSARGFDTFIALVAGMVAAPARRTVCGMFTASGMQSRWHHSRAHRFFTPLGPTATRSDWSCWAW
jgi:hypothetical protein